MDAVEKWLVERGNEFPPDSVECKTLLWAATMWHGEGSDVLQWEGYGSWLERVTTAQMVCEIIARVDPEHERHGL